MRCSCEHPPSHSQLIDVTLAPMCFHTLFGTPLDTAQAYELVDRLLRLATEQQ